MMIGDRIKLARARKAYSLEQLAHEIGVTKQAISKYELARSMPSSGVLVRLAHALGVKPEFFLRQRGVTLNEVSFRRHRSRLSNKQEQAILANVREWLERYVEAESILGAEAQLPFRLPPQSQRTARSLEAIEGIADHLRRYWELGSDPIEHVVALLEDKGAKVNAVEAPEGFDGLTTEVGGSPVIVARRGVPWDRQRFSLAHELGHLVLKTSPGLDQDAAANRFAAAFLVPHAAAGFELRGRRKKLEPRELLLLKLKYGLSMQGWVLRARDLGILSHDATQRMMRAFRARQWHKQEPGHVPPPEEPRRLRLLVMQALAEDLISESKAAELLGKSLWSLRTELGAA